MGCREARILLRATASLRIPAHTNLINGSALLVIPDAATQVADPGHQAHLRNRRLVSAGPWKHVVDLGYFAFRLLVRGVEFLAKRLASGVLEVLASTPSNCLALGLPIATANPSLILPQKT